MDDDAPDPPLGVGKYRIRICLWETARGQQLRDVVDPCGAGASSAPGKPSLARVFKASSQSKRIHLDDRKFDSAAIHATLTPYVQDWTLHFRFIDIHLLFRSESASIGLFRAFMEDLQCGVPGCVHSWE